MNELKITNGRIYSNNAVSVVHDLETNKIHVVLLNPYANILNFVDDVNNICLQIRQNLQPVAPSVVQNVTQPLYIQPQQVTQGIYVQPAKPVVTANDDKQVIQLNGKSYLKIGNQIFEISSPQKVEEPLGQQMNFNSNPQPANITMNNPDSQVSVFHQKAAPQDFAPRTGIHKQAILDGIKL